MCASCKLNTKLNITNIEKYLQLNNDDILTVKMNKERIRSLITIKNKPKKNKIETPTTHFYNQITVVVRINNGPTNDINTEPRINMKLFKNGSVQMSGCKSISGINNALNKLIFKLNEKKAKIENGIISEIAFIDESLVVSEEKTQSAPLKNNEQELITVKNFKIDMINSNYQIAMQIDRDKLFKLLLKKKIKSSYEPCIRACVIIKFSPSKENPDNKENSIFIFQKGNIIITGARSKSHIISSYNYINDILLLHKDEITKKDEKYDEELILRLYNEVINECNIGHVKL
jgi:TATA-box binding protein (TBP) (component of TFIID and TFIIIB)